MIPNKTVPEYTKADSMVSGFLNFLNWGFRFACHDGRCLPESGRVEMETVITLAVTDDFSETCRVVLIPYK